MRLLIADDEPIALKSIEMMIRREFKEIEIVGLAQNGIEAKELLEKTQPELAILDIRMPGLSGLEVIELEQLSGKTHYIISTAYSDFNYVHTALNLKVDGYILKPTKREELIQVIRKTMSLIEREQKEMLKKTHAQIALRVVNPTLESEFIRSFSNGRPDFEKLQTWQEINQLSKSNACFIRLEGRLQQLQEGAFAKAISNVLQDVCHFMLGAIENSTVYVLIFFPEELKMEAYSSWMEGISKLINQHILRVFEIQLENQIGTIAYSNEQLISSYQSMQRSSSMNLTNAKINIETHDGPGYIASAKKYMDVYYRSDISLETCAEAIGISSYYLSHLFKIHSDQTFNEYLTAKRMQVAQQLCCDLHIPLKEISERCGYNNTNYFYKVFKKYTGMAVGEYRAKHTNGGE